MKAPTFHNSIASLLLGFGFLLSLTTSGLAATNPLNSPHGLAVDATGNLWVANMFGGAGGTGDILVFSPGYALEKAKTITQNIAAPTAVAFDPNGNLWVADYNMFNGVNYGSIVEYANGQPTGTTVTSGISLPLGMAIDGVGDIYVMNGVANITVYESLLSGPPQGPISTFTRYAPYTAVGASAGLVEIGDTTGGDGELQAYSVFPLLNTGDICQPISQCESGLGLSNSVVAIANAGRGNLYLALSGGAVLQWQPGTANLYQVVSLSYVATGMATDLLRERLYIADGADNTIYVYSTANGTLLKTIQ